MYRIFIKDQNAETGEFVEFSRRYSDVLQCSIPTREVIGRIDFDDPTKSRKKQHIIVKDLMLYKKKTFPYDQMAEAVAFGKQHFKTYNNE